MGAKPQIETPPNEPAPLEAKETCPPGASTPLLSVTVAVHVAFPGREARITGLQSTVVVVGFGKESTAIPSVGLASEMKVWSTDVPSRFARPTKNPLPLLFVQ